MSTRGIIASPTTAGGWRGVMVRPSATAWYAGNELLRLARREDPAALMARVLATPNGWDPWFTEQLEETEYLTAPEAWTDTLFLLDPLHRTLASYEAPDFEHPVEVVAIDGDGHFTAPRTVLEDLPVSADEAGEPEDHARAREAGARALRSWLGTTDQHPGRVRRTIERAWEDTLSEVVATLPRDRSYDTAFVMHPADGGPAWSVGLGRYTARFAPRTSHYAQDGLFVRDDWGVASYFGLGLVHSFERKVGTFQRFAHHLTLSASHRPFQEAARTLVCAMFDASVRAIGHRGMLHLRSDTVFYGQGTAARATEDDEDRQFPWVYWCWVSVRTMARELR